MESFHVELLYFRFFCRLTVVWLGKMRLSAIASKGRKFLFKVALDALAGLPALLVCTNWEQGAEKENSTILEASSCEMVKWTDRDYPSDIIIALI